MLALEPESLEVEDAERLGDGPAPAWVSKR
jgi:hypothetical protein